MEIKFVDDQGEWNVPLSKSKNSQLLQTWEWGVFQQTFGRPAYRLQVIERDKVYCSMQCFEYKLPTGRRYLYAPRGPVFLTEDESLFDIIIHRLNQALKSLTRVRGYIFSRIEPVSTNKLSVEGFLPLGFKTIKSTQPQDDLSAVLDFLEEDLLKSMHEKTRYNVRLASKHGVKVRLIEEINYARRVFPMFWDLIQETAKRQKIKTHPRAYYARMVDILVPAGMLKFIIAEINNEIIATNLLGVFGDTVTYLHGGSSYKHRALMAPFVLHWEGMRLAKALGKKYYNFGGVSPEGVENHQWNNLTRFKEGFVEIGKTGERFHYAGGLDLVSKPFWYRIYTLVKKTKKIIRWR